MKKSFLSPQSTVPLFQQIVAEIERRILLGEIPEGDFLPSVREFALQNAVNPNTVAKAYQQLQTLGHVEPIRGTGLKVKPLSQKKADLRRDELLNEKIEECVRAAKALGVSIPELIEILRERVKK